MDRKSLTFSVVVEASITLSLIPTTAPLNAAQQNDAAQNRQITKADRFMTEAHQAPAESPPVDPGALRWLEART